MWALRGDGGPIYPDPASGKKKLTCGAFWGFQLPTGRWRRAPGHLSEGKEWWWKPLEIDTAMFIDWGLLMEEPNLLAFWWTENMNKIQERVWQLNGNCLWDRKRRGGKGSTVTCSPFMEPDSRHPATCTVNCRAAQGVALGSCLYYPCLRRAGQEAEVPLVCEHPVNTEGARLK